MRSVDGDIVRVRNHQARAVSCRGIGNGRGVAERAIRRSTAIATSTAASAPVAIRAVPASSAVCSVGAGGGAALGRRAGGGRGALHPVEAATGR